MARIRGLERSSGLTSTKQSELPFRAVLTEGGVRVLFQREGFDRLGKTLP
jgi:hypothetical protein